MQTRKHTVDDYTYTHTLKTHERVHCHQSLSRKYLCSMPVSERVFVCVHQRWLVGGAIGVRAISNGGNWINATVKSGFHMFDVFDTIPFIPFQPLQWARPPIAPPTNLHWCAYLCIYICLTCPKASHSYRCWCSSQQIWELQTTSINMIHNLYVIQQSVIPIFQGQAQHPDDNNTSKK
jgi:hypothetical protein